MANDPNVPDPDDDKPLGPNGEKALKAERELRAKAEADAADLKKRLDALEKAQLSKEEAAVKRAEEAEARAAKLEAAENLRKLRAKVAEETSDDDVTIPSDLLTGETEDELKASAERLKGFITSGPRKPAVNPHQGQNTGEPNDEDAEALAILGFGS